MAPPDKVEKVRSLLRRAQKRVDVNDHEADTAQKRADELIAKYNITVNDIGRLDETELVGEVLSQSCDPMRLLLANAVARVHGCVIGINSNHWMRARGEAKDASIVKDVYQHLESFGISACNSSYYGIPKSLQPLQRARFWTGYVLTLVDRLGLLPVQPVPIEVVPVDATRTVENMSEAEDVTKVRPAAKTKGAKSQETRTTKSNPPTVDAATAASVASAAPPTADSIPDTKTAEMIAAKELLKNIPPENVYGMLKGIFDNGLTAGQAAGRSVSIPSSDAAATVLPKGRLGK